MAINKIDCFIYSNNYYYSNKIFLKNVINIHNFIGRGSYWWRIYWSLWIGIEWESEESAKFRVFGQIKNHNSKEGKKTKKIEKKNFK